LDIVLPIVAENLDIGTPVKPWSGAAVQHSVCELAAFADCGCIPFANPYQHKTWN